MEGNAYWEQRVKYYEQSDEENIVKRIKECQFVLDKLDKDELWKIILKDIAIWTEQVDSRWQDVYDETQLRQMRTVKLAATHLNNLKNTYTEDYRYAQEELASRKKKDIEKDYEV